MKKNILIAVLSGFIAPLLITSTSEARWPTLHSFKSKLRNGTLLVISGKFTYSKNELGEIPKKLQEVRRQRWSTCRNFARGWDPKGPATRIVVKSIGYTSAVHSSNKKKPKGTFTFHCNVEARP